MVDRDDDSADLPHIVLINDEEQHSLWRADLDIPGGWRQVFGPGSKTECLAYVDTHWTDMRPLSLRRFMEEHPAR